MAPEILSERPKTISMVRRLTSGDALTVKTGGFTATSFTEATVVTSYSPANGADYAPREGRTLVDPRDF